jgi:hypothetical protein
MGKEASCFAAFFDAAIIPQIIKIIIKINANQDRNRLIFIVYLL